MRWYSNPRVWLQFPLLFLGSCYPFQPPTTQIYVVNGTEIPRSKAIDPAMIEVGCNQSNGKTYVLPPIPDFEGVADDDKDAIIEVLTEHIGVLRQELKRIAVACNSAKRP